MKTIRALIVLIIVGLGAAVAYAYSGWYDVSVGTGHNAVTEWYLETLRERSIEARAAELTVPADIDSRERIEAGAGHYKDMCAGCHGHPGREPSDSFDPRPPALYEHAESPAEAFWIVKNGIKMSAMPHHHDHSDEDMWNIAAFLQKLPEMSAGEYEAITADAEHTHADGGHEHDGGGDESESVDSGGNEGHAHETPGDPVATVDAFHHALAEGDREAALGLLHANATILEGGNLQTKDAYASGHLGSDMAFLAAVDTETLSREVTSDGKQATVTTRTRMSGTYQENPVDTVGVETAALVKTDTGWRITSLVWSHEAKEASAEGGGS